MRRHCKRPMQVYEGRLPSIKVSYTLAVKEVYHVIRCISSLMQPFGQGGCSMWKDRARVRRHEDKMILTASVALQTFDAGILGLLQPVQRLASPPIHA